MGTDKQPWFRSLEPVLQRSGFSIAQRASELGATLELADGADAVLLFKIGRGGVGEGLLDYQNRRQCEWLLRILGRKKIRSHDVFVFVQRLKVKMRDDALKRTFDEQLYEIDTPKKIETFSKALSKELSSRLIPALRSTRLEQTLEPDFWLRRGVMTFFSSEAPSPYIEADGTVIETEETREEVEQRTNIYWRKGAFIDLATLLALGRLREAGQLIDRMPRKIDISQAYLISREAISDEVWYRARANVDEIRNELKVKLRRARD